MGGWERGQRGLVLKFGQEREARAARTEELGALSDAGIDARDMSEDLFGSFMLKARARWIGTEEGEEVEMARERGKRKARPRLAFRLACLGLTHAMRASALAARGQLQEDRPS